MLLPHPPHRLSRWPLGAQKSTVILVLYYERYSKPVATLEASFEPLVLLCGGLWNGSWEPLDCAREKRALYAKRCLLRMRVGRARQKLKPLNYKRIFFTDEKVFRYSRTMSCSTSTQNSRVWIDKALTKAQVDPDLVYEGRVQQAKGLMVACGVS